MKLRSKILIAGAVASSVLAGGAAFAFFTTNGGGTGNASTGSATPVNVTNNNSIGNLIPDGPAQTITLQVSSGQNGQYVPAVKVALGTLPSGCLAADFTFPGGDTVVIDDVFPAGTTVVASPTLSIKMVDTGISQDGCAGKTIPLVYTVVPIPAP